MTIQELEHTLPNGFHDSFLVGMEVDFVAGTCTLVLEVDYDGPEPEVFRRMKLQLRGLCLFIIDPPDRRYPFSTGRIQTCGDTTSEQMLPNLESYRKSAPPGAFFYSFYLTYYNCFIHFAATGAELIDG